MRSDRGPGPSSPDPALTSSHKADSEASLDEPASPPQPAPRTGAPVPDGGFTSDPDDDTTTFKSALSSSEAIRREMSSEVSEDNNTGTPEISSDATQQMEGDSSGTPGVSSPPEMSSETTESSQGNTNGIALVSSPSKVSSGALEQIQDKTSNAPMASSPQEVPSPPELSSDAKESLEDKPNVTPAVLSATEMSSDAADRPQDNTSNTPGVSTVTATPENRPGPGLGSPPDLWRLGDGRTVRDVVEHRLAAAEGGGPSPQLDSLTPESASHVHGSGPESMGFLTGGPESLSMTDDDYYEDFTLPGTHEAVMSRQLSFRRRVRAEPVPVPDADRIEGVVRAGQLERHGSIRRRLVTSASSGAAAAATSGESPGKFGRDLREIEELMAEDGDQVPLDELPSLGSVLGTSTPKNGDQPVSLTPLGEEPLSMEMSTVMKIKGCLDREKVRDIYKISGRLQDILTQEDIQEILAHQEMYAELLGEEILMELKNSMSESQPSLSLTEPEPSPDLKPQQSASGEEQPVPNIQNDRVVDLDPSPDTTPVSSPPNSITVKAEVNNVLDVPSTAPAPSPRHRIRLGSEIAADPEIPHCEDAASSAGIPSPLPDRSDTPEGRLWRCGSVRRLAHGGGSVEALFTESEAAPTPGQRRLQAPDISVSLEDLDRSPLTPTRHDSLEDVGITAPQRQQKPADADSGVSEETLADHSGEFGGEQALTPAQNAERPNTLGAPRRRKISVSADVLGGGGSTGDGAESEDTLSSSRLDSEQATPTEALASSDLLDTLTPDDIETPDGLEDSILERLPPAEPIPEYSAREELQNERSWRTCVVAGLERRIDMKVIEPYKKVLSHGGYLGVDAEQAIIVFSACYLPDRSRRDYSYVMDNLFLYVLTTLDALIADDYVLIYLHGATKRSCMPAFGWLKRCYQMVDRRLRKNLKGLYLVHPTFWVKTIVALTRPFISSKFSRKLRFVAGLRELSQLVPMDHVCIPDRVKQLDFQQMISERKKQLGIR